MIRSGSTGPSHGSIDLLVRTDVVEVAQPDERHADEAATLLEQHAEQAFEQVGLAEDVVVEEQGVPGVRVVEEELALLREPPPGQVPVRLDLAAARSQQAQRRQDLGRADRAVREVGTLGLVGDDDAEPGQRLRAQAGQRDGERLGPIARGDQDVEERLVRGDVARHGHAVTASAVSTPDIVGACERMRSTIAVVERSSAWGRIRTCPPYASTTGASGTGSCTRPPPLT